MEKAKCFFSYNWDNEDRIAILQYLKSEVETQSRGRVAVVLDRETFRYGEDVINNEQCINESDCVVVFFSPEYKAVVDSGDTLRGVYREYKLITKKQEEMSDCVIPILLKGNKNQAVPEEFLNKLYCELTGCKTFKDDGKRTKISREYENKVSNLVSTIIKRSISFMIFREYKFLNDEEKFNALFKNYSADDRLPASCIVKLPAYDEIIGQHKHFVIGRKGSGKSTLLDALKKCYKDKMMNEYKPLEPINAEDIDSSRVYNLTQKFIRDQNEFPSSYLLELYWNVFFIIQGIYITCIDVEDGGIYDKRKEVFWLVNKRFRNSIGYKKGDLRAIFVKRNISALSIELIENMFTNDAFDYANEETLTTSIRLNMNVENIIRLFLGNKLSEKYMDAMRYCNRRILITLDGFDAKSEQFRLNTVLMEKSNPEEYCKRIDFERTFFQSLMIVVDTFKTSGLHCDINSMCSIMDFCIVLPQDRWDQIMDDDRDSIKRNVCCLTWDALQLLEMVVLRFESYYKIKAKDDFEDITVRLKEIIKDKLPCIPLSIPMIINGVEYSFDLITYILRLSFWRPRDIQLHFANILSLSQFLDTKKNVKDLDATLLVRNMLKQSSRRIIREEFIKEYSHVFYNLQDVLGNFKESDLIMDAHEFFSKLSKIKFREAFCYDCLELNNKVKVLYQLGIIGIYFTRDTDAVRYGSHICFWFNEGYDAYDQIETTNDFSRTNYKIIINPLFMTELELKTNTTELIGNFNSTYIYSQHGRSTAIRRL
jgi:energy-coupling factor transporter ATP-binding protein EcfA2